MNWFDGILKKSDCFVLVSLVFAKKVRWIVGSDDIFGFGPCEDTAQRAGDEANRPPQANTKIT